MSACVDNCNHPECNKRPQPTTGRQTDVPEGWNPDKWRALSRVERRQYARRANRNA